MFFPFIVHKIIQSLFGNMLEKYLAHYITSGFTRLRLPSIIFTRHISADGNITAIFWLELLNLHFPGWMEIKEIYAGFRLILHSTISPPHTQSCILFTTFNSNYLFTEVMFEVVLTLLVTASY